MPILAFFEEGFSDLLFSRLMWGIIPVVVLVLIVMLIVRIVDRRNKSHDNIGNMLAEDEKANMVRMKKIGEDHFYRPDISQLPIKEYSETEIAADDPIYIWQKKVLSAADKKMMHFEQDYTNIDLKNMFGAAALEFIARYEENFTNFTHALRHWAQALINESHLDEAKKVLEFAVEAGSEISQTYTMLADIYAAHGSTMSIKALKNTLVARNMPGKATAQEYLNKYL